MTIPTRDQGGQSETCHMIEKIKKDWDNFKTGIIIVAVLLIISTLLGRGMCVVREMLGFPCPGCGLTRSFLLILQGRFVEAWQMHPFSYGWIAFGVVLFVDRYVLRGKEILWKIALIVLCTGMLVFYLYRLFTGGLVGI